MLFAHSKRDAPENIWHLLEDHLTEVGRLAAAFAADFAACEWGRAAGELHDAGKATDAFQEYLRLCAQGRGVRGSAPHTAHGARLAIEHHKKIGKLLAYVICGHHGGMPDYRELPQRLENARNVQQAALFATDCLPNKIPLPGSENPLGIQLPFFIRMVFSCLVDADWLDTEAFMDAEKASWRTGAPCLKDIHGHFFAKMREKFGSVDNTAVNAARNEVLQACQQAASNQPGMFSLTVPTGGGKTLASLAFALRHAEQYGLKRIVYVIPYMSIIEQNAAVFRQFMGEDAVVEHHSAYDPDQKDSPESDDESGSETTSLRRRIKLACENWDAPLVATTAVQFFESLYSNKPSRCRKLHNLAKSVIILDEAQMMPRHVLLPCLSAIRELSANYGASVVLCTATQPAINKRKNFPHGLDAREIMKDPASLHKRLQRTFVSSLGELDDTQLCLRLETHDQALCIVNTRAHAAKLFAMLCERPGVYHLSANMTPAHRSRKIAAIKAVLEQDAPCLLIATSLIECGVDVSFPVVYRALAGLDSIAQSAGRCDREGLLTAAKGAPAGQVFVFSSSEHKDPPHLHSFVDATKEVLQLDFPDLLAPEAIEKYFHLLYWQAAEKLDQQRILNKLAEGAANLDFPFREVADAFQYIEQQQVRTLLIPFDDHEGIMRLLESLAYAKSPRSILRKLQKHTIQIYVHQLKELLRQGVVGPVLDGQVEGFYVLLDAEAYNEEQGLRIGQEITRESIERNIV